MKGREDTHIQTHHTHTKWESTAICEDQKEGSFLFRGECRVMCKALFWFEIAVLGKLSSLKVWNR